MGFMFAVNHFAGLYENGLSVGDVTDVQASNSSLRPGTKVKVIRVVKRANASDSGQN